MTGPDGLTYREGYFGNRLLRNEFKRFLREIHGLDLTRWEACGFWDEGYRAFSLLDGDRMVASVCLYSMDMTIGGAPRRVGQFSGVGTVPGRRRRGLGRWLSERALAWAAPGHDGFFLFADEEALPFYARLGFTRASESVPVLAVEPPAPRPGMRRIEVDDDHDLALLTAIARRRAPASEALGVRNPELLLFHCLYTLPGRAWFVPDLNAAVFFSVEEGRLTLFDVAAARIPSFAELHPYLAGIPHHEVRFRFEPDRMGVEPSSRLPLEENNLHLHPSLRLPASPILFPYTAHA